MLTQTVDNSSSIRSKTIKLKRTERQIQQQVLADRLGIRKDRLRRIENSPCYKVQGTLKSAIIRNLDLNDVEQRMLLCPTISAPQAICCGDINYDIVYSADQVSPFPTRPPGVHYDYERLNRGIGGTAVRFARAAQKAGFQKPVVVGALGNDPLAVTIRYELYLIGLEALIKELPGKESGLVTILRHKAAKSRDVTTTITDACRGLPPVVDILNRLNPGDLLFISGYTIVEAKPKHKTRPHVNERQWAQVQELAEKACAKKAWVAFDVTVDLDRTLSWHKFQEGLKGNVHFLIAEIATLLKWWAPIRQASSPSESPRENDRNYVLKRAIPRLRRKLDPEVILLRTSTQEWEYRWTKDDDEIVGPEPFEEYMGKKLGARVGAVDEATASFLRAYLIRQSTYATA